MDTSLGRLVLLVVILSPALFYMLPSGGKLIKNLGLIAVAVVVFGVLIVTSSAVLDAIGFVLSYGWLFAVALLVAVVFGPEFSRYSYTRDRPVVLERVTKNR